MKKFLKPRMKVKRLQVRIKRAYKASKNWLLNFLNWDTIYSSYKSLSPIDSADKDGQYYHALKWALKNREAEGIRNIALTGGYGSGKSSILKTFQSRYKPKRIKYIRRGIKYLNISLATFKEEKIPTDPERQKKILQLIEESILQQIFYHEKDTTIPDSRFKKIKRIGLVRLVLTAVCLFVFLAAIVNYFYPCFLLEAFRDFRFGWNTWKAIHYATYLILAVGVFWIILKSIRTISAVTINKLKLSDAEIGFGDKTNKSTLNHHLDEIIYFFEATGYNVVCIEDLDRFQETEIFTKLREINLLLNNSRKTRHLHIVFIYAVRDEMFKDKDRTKFFDFIVPVIPVINSSNSAEKLITKRNDNKYKITNDFIESISLFIDDMRLLHNVTNEFKLYSSLLDPTLKPDNLLAMMLYKNIMPNDFSSLAKGEGLLYKCLTSKNTYITANLQAIDEQIKVINADIEALLNLKITDVRELRKLYILQYLDGLSRFQNFSINSTQVSIGDINTDGNFEYLIKDQAGYFNTSGYAVALNRSFSDVEKLVSPKPYALRLKEIEDWNTGKIDLLRAQVRVLDNQKINIRNSRLQDMLRESVSGMMLDEVFHELESITAEDGQKIVIKITDKELIKFLLRNGYINEEYLDYISIFYEGVITRTDKQFLIQIKSDRSLPFDYRLSKIENIIKKISPVEFEREHILNYDLLNFMLDKKEYVTLVERIFNKLKDQSAPSIEFIDKFSELTPHQTQFYQGLIAKWPNMWKFIKTSVSISDEKKQTYFKSIIAFANLDMLLEMSKNSTLKNDILEYADFLSMIPDSERLKLVIDKLELKFTIINFASSPEEMVNFIYEQNAYAINRYMLTNLLIHKRAIDQVAFDNRNYEAIKESKCPELISYIEKNIDQYISQVYLTIESNKSDVEEYLIMLLNNDLVTQENKAALLKNTTFRIKNLENIKSEIWDAAVELDKVEALWPNVLSYYSYSSNAINDKLISFLSKAENAQKLSSVQMPEVEGSNLYFDFSKTLLQTIKIKDDAFELLIMAVPWLFSDLELSAHGPAKINALIDQLCIEISKNTYDYLKNTFKQDAYHIRLLQTSKNKFFETPSQYALDGNDVNTILNSTMFSTAEKMQVLSIVGDDLLLTNLQNLNSLAKLMKADGTFAIHDGLFQRVITHPDISITERLQLFIRRNHQVHDSSEIEYFLNSLALPYAALTTPDTPEIEMPYTESAETLLKILKAKSYILEYRRKKDKLIVTKNIPG